MVRLGLDESDGIITNILTVDDLDTVLAHAGPVAPGKEFVVKVFMCPTGDALWIHGTPDECRDQVRAFARPGVTTVLQYVAPTPELASGAADLPETIAALRP
jgi:hypothetical protein